MLKALLSKKPPQLLGLDIGTRFIKAVLLEQHADSIRVVGCACEAINGNAFQEREIKDFEPVSNALKKIKLALKLKKQAVAAAVSGASVITKVVYMEPGQSDPELESQIEIEADSLIPYPLDEVYLDFEEVGESHSHLGKVDVLLSAAHKDLVDSRVTLLREMEFEPQVMDIEGYALGNALLAFGPVGEQQVTCCINLGASQLQVCAVADNQVLYSKEHQFGADNLMQDIAMMHGLERDEAERQLVADTLPDTWRQDSYPIFLSNLVQSIQRALQMYTSATKQDSPKQLLIAGGTALLEGLAGDLSRDLGIKVDLFDPFAGLALSEKAASQNISKLAPQMALAAGLASRSFSAWHR